MRSNFFRLAEAWSKPPQAVALIFLAAAVIRVLTLLTAQLWRDEAIVGIMSLRVLAGDFPVFFYGQNYMGALEAYLSAVLVLLFGTRPWVLELLPLILSLLFLFLIWQLGNRIFPPGVVRTALLYLALPPVFLLDWAHEARPHYPLTLIFGTLLILFADRVIYRSPPRAERRWDLAALGLLAGLGWWTNYLVVVYLLPVFLFLWLKDKKLPLRGTFLLLVLLFFAGQIPRLLYQTRQPLPPLQIHELILWPAWKTIAYDFFGNALPILGGVPYPLAAEPGKWIPYGIFLTLLAASLFYVFSKRRAALTALLRGNTERTTGIEMVVLVFLATLAISCLTVFNVRLNDNDQKYLLPVYTALPFFLAFFLDGLKKRFRAAGLLLLGLLLGCNLWGILIKPGWPILDRERRRAMEQEAKTDGAILQALRERGIQRLYAWDDLNARLTFLAAEKVVAVNPYQAVCLRYSRWVDGAARPAYLMPDAHTEWEGNFQALGAGWRKTYLAGGYVLYSDFIPPAVSFVPLSRAGWTAADPSLDPSVFQAFDGDMASRWVVPQKIGEFFLLDLGRLETIGKVVWWPGDYRDVPAGYQVEVSATGREWQRVTRVDHYRGPFFWAGPGPMMKIRKGWVETCFAPIRARYVKLTLVGERPGGAWSINEILVYGIRKAPAVAEAGPESLGDLSAFLREEKIKQVYGDPWLSAFIHNQSAGKVETLIFNYFLGDNGERHPPPEYLHPLDINRDLAVIVERTEQDDCAATLNRAGFSYRLNAFGPYRVFSRLEKIPLVRISRSGWKITANTNPEGLEQAVDGKITTRWSSLRSQAPGMSIRLDLGRREAVGGVMLMLGDSIRDYPRDLRITVSADGKSWLKPEVSRSGGLYWAGNRLFDFPGERLVYSFAPVSCRFLQLEQVGSDSAYYWSIHELEVTAAYPASRAR